MASKTYIRFVTGRGTTETGKRWIKHSEYHLRKKTWTDMGKNVLMGRAMCDKEGEIGDLWAMSTNPGPLCKECDALQKVI